MDEDFRERNEQAALVGDTRHHSTYQSIPDGSDEPPEYPGLINVVPEANAHCEYQCSYIVYFLNFSSPSDLLISSLDYLYLGLFYRSLEPRGGPGFLF